MLLPPLLFALLLLNLNSIQSLPPICDQSTKWNLDGRDIVHESRGFILLAVFMSLQDANADAQLDKLKSITSTLRDVRVVIIAPGNEEARSLEDYRTRYPQMTIEGDATTDSASSKLGASDNDNFIYDRCGRIANVIRHPRSNVSRYEDTVNSLKAAINYAHCGWCNYNLRAAPTQAYKTSQVTAYLHPAANRVASSYDTASGNVNKDRSGEVPRTSHQATQTENTRQHRVNNRQDSSSTSRDGRLESAQHSRPKAAPASSRRPLSTPMDRRFDDWRPSTQFPNQMPAAGTSNEAVDRSRSQQASLSSQQDSYREQQTRRRHEELQKRERERVEAERRREEDLRTQREEEDRRLRQEQDRIRKEEEQRLREKENRIREEEEIRRKETENRIREEEERRQKESENRIREEEERRNRENEERRNREEYERQNRRQHQNGQELGQNRRLYQQQAANAPQSQGSTTRTGSGEAGRKTVGAASSGASSGASSRIGMTSGGPEVPPLYGSDEDEEYVDYGNAKIQIPTTAPVQLQIPPTPASTEWPTPFTFFDNIPCGAFTDDVCYQQIKTMGKHNASKCCNKGVYLTDLCVPGRCSNATAQLCCMQKFFQSKFMCCDNSTNSAEAAGDSFSKCCYSRFIDSQDSCCPKQLAKYHWLSTSELCLPNVRVDLSQVRISVNLGESTNKLTVDLGEDRSWDHKCTHSNANPQFVFMPDDDLNEDSDEDT